MATWDDLQRRIQIVRHKERRTVFMVGGCKVVLCLAASIVGYFLIDWLFDLPYFARLFTACLGTGFVLYALNKHLLRELKKTLDDDDLVLRVEKRHPELRGRLISTLQLLRAGQEGAYVGSPELVLALEEETVEMAGPINFLLIVNTAALKRFTLVAGLAILLKLVLIIRFPGYITALAERLVSSEAQYPARTKIAKVEVPEYVARGDDINVRVILDKTSAVPDQPGCCYFHGQGGNDVYVDLGPSNEEGVYTGKLAKAVGDVDLTVKIGDAHTRPQHISVMARPEVDLDASTIQYKLPQYARLSETKRRLMYELKLAKSNNASAAKVLELENQIAKEPDLPDPPPDKFGGISVLCGSTADIAITSTKPLHTAALERLDRTIYKFEPVGAERLKWRLKDFPVCKSGSFHVLLTDKDNLTGSQPPVEYFIDAKPDLPPVVKLTKPAKDITVTPVAKLQVVFGASDDYGLKCVWLCYRSQTGQASTASLGEVKRIEIAVPPLKNIPDVKFVWELATLNIKPEDQIVFWLEADDDCTNENARPAVNRRQQENQEVSQQAAGKAYSRSSEVKLTVITREEKAAELETEIQRFCEQLKTQEGLQEDVKRQVLHELELLQQQKENLQN